jgi:acetyl-CoA carboxylase biotin carboxyl carrier protein
LAFLPVDPSEKVESPSDAHTAAHGACPSLETLRLAIEIFESSELFSVSYSYESENLRYKIKLSKGQAPSQGAQPGVVYQPAAHYPSSPDAKESAPLPAVAPAEDTRYWVTAPMVGTVYLAPKPGDPTFVKVGDQIAQGQALLIIEAMKVMNTIKSPISGRVQEILIQDASPTEYGQKLIAVMPS